MAKNPQTDYQMWHEVVSLNIRTNEMLIALLPSISKTVEEATIELTEKFKFLAATAKEQNAMVEKVIKVMSSTSGEGMSFMDMELFISKISDLSIQMNECIAFADRAIGEDNINIETLSELSTKIGDVSADFHHKINNIMSTISQTPEQKDGKREELYDRNKFLRLVECVLKQQAEFGTALERGAKSSSMIASTISAMIMDIQFQDRVSQYIGTLVSALTIQNEAMQQVQQEIKIHIDDENKNKIHTSTAKKMIDNLKMADIRNNFIQHLINAKHINDAQEITGQQAGPVDESPEDELF